MNTKQIVQLGLSAILIFTLAFGLASCKKDDNPAGPGPGGLSTINFSDAHPSVTIVAGVSSTSFILAGGTTPYTVTSTPSSSIALVVINGDTVTITAVGAGSDSVTIQDNTAAQAPKTAMPPKLVTIYITVASSGGGGVTDLFDFPIPNVGNIAGILGAQYIVINIPGVGTTGYSAGFGAFFGATTSDLVYGGTVMLNDSTLDTSSYGGKVTYWGDANVTYNGSSSANFTVSGNGSVPAFNASIVAPTITSITSPAQNATVSRSSDLTITWDGTGADSMIIVVAGFSGGAITKTGLANNGSLTITSSELSGITAGTGIITVVKYKYAIHTESAKNYLVVAETYQYVSVTFN